MSYRPEINFNQSFKKQIKALPKGVTSLDLSKRNLGSELDVSAMTEAFAALPTTVKSLNLSENNLTNYEVDDLKKILAAIPTTVKSLNLSTNDLTNPEDDDEVKKILAAIPSNVDTINICFNNFREIDNLKLLKDALPFVRTVVIDRFDVDDMSKEKLSAFAQMMPKLNNVEVIGIDKSPDNSDNVIYPYNSDNVIYLQGCVARSPFQAFKNGEKIDLNINPQKFEDHLNSLNTLMEIANKSSRFESFSLFFNKNNRQAIIRQQAFEAAEKYHDAHFEKGSEESISFWKKMMEQPIFSLQRRAPCFHSRDGLTTTVKRIQEEKIKAYESEPLRLSKIK